MELFRQITFLVFGGISLYCFYFIFKSPFLAARREKEMAQIEVLQARFEQRVPNGWLFHDGEGRW